MSLSDRPARTILRAVSDAAARWTDGDFPPRVRALDRVVQRTGYCEPAVEYAFDALFASLNAADLERAIARELGDVAALDGFVIRGRNRERALPAGRVCIVSSRTTVGVAIVPAVFALLAKCDVLVKDREDALVSAFFATLGEELHDFRNAAIAQTWDGAGRDLSEFDVVAAFGDDETLASIARGLNWKTRFIGYGAKASAGYVGCESLATRRDAERVAEGVARDLALFETEGCLSLHALFVEAGGEVPPGEFAEILARAVRRAAIEFPPARPDAAIAARVAAARDGASFRASQGGFAVHSDAEASYLVECDASAERPPDFLPRAIRLQVVDGPEAAAAYLRRHRVPLEALALDGVRDDLTRFAVGAGASRIASFGALQTPGAGSRHGGRPRIAEFVRWVSDERDA
ncbi:MAG: hypothetical protein JOY98_01575 [Candidatus Eremiobacteraeota bacterium]|nr:hypothetical protein [Candidatus Eremiobacteraeota bacterium]